MPIYLKLQTVKGESTAKEHVGWIELNSLSWGINRNTGDGKKKDTSGDIVFTKDADSTSVTLARLAIDGRPQPATIDFVDGQGKVYLQFQLRDVLVASHKFSGSGSDLHQITETVGLSYAKMTIIKFSADTSADSTDVFQDLWATPSP